ncbi:MAG: metallophosphoesterase [Anaerolineae bacterium]|nr:metallophosphoesterase [Anaerolineae bacterium]
MARFIFLTDTHLGATNDVGYTQQPRRADQLPALLALLDAWIVRDAAVQRSRGGEPISFVLHGGDMVDDATPESVRAAGSTFRLSVPIYLALGNHDVTRRDSAEVWLTEARRFFPEGGFVTTLEGDSWILHIIPTQWCDTRYLWEQEQRPHILAEHLASLERSLAAHPDALHLLCTHGEVLGVPPDQTGRREFYHAPLPAYTATVADLLQRYPQLRGVLGGHNHINTHGSVHQAHVVTGSAFVETPFEFKVVDVSGAGWSMRTVALLPQVPFRAEYDWDRTFVQGRACDRTVMSM